MFCVAGCARPSPWQLSTHVRQEWVWKPWKLAGLVDSSDISSGLLWYLPSNFHTGSDPLLVMTHLSSHLTAEYKTVPSERIGYISIWPYVALVGFYTSVCGGIVIQSLHLCLLEKRMVLFANWPHSSECQLHRCKIRQKLIKPCWGFQGLKPRFIIVNSFF